MYSAMLWDSSWGGAVQRAHSKLDYRSQILIERHMAVCMDCRCVLPMRRRPTWEDLAAMFEGSTAKGALSPLESPANRVLLAPIGNPVPKESAIPLESQLVLKGMPTNRKMVCGRSFQNAKIPRASNKEPGDFYAALIKRLRLFVCHAAQPLCICR